MNIKNTVVLSSTGIGRPTRRLHVGKHGEVELSICTNHVPSYMTYGQVLSENRRSEVGCSCS